VKHALAKFNEHAISFDGQLLKRGFWLYVWRIGHGSRTVFYVGRTGDTSSENAASPFNRLSQHLSLRKNSKGNALARNLAVCGMNPEECRFEFFALGHLYPETKSVDVHKELRDLMMAAERFAADWLRERGKEVLGEHPRKRDCELNLQQIVEKFLLSKFA
jgi:hypothetical protein